MDKHKDLALLLMRVGLGVMMMTHGIPKLIGGPEKWTMLGNAMPLVSGKLNLIWGLIAALTESLGGLLVVIGLFFRPACFFILMTMAVAAISHFDRGDGLKGASHAIETGFAFLGLLMLGPGKYSIKK